MVWAILALLGVPLWICAAGITVLGREEPWPAESTR